MIQKECYYISPNGKGKQIKWLCQCDCGNITSVVSSSLRKGKTISCGCYEKEIFKTRMKQYEFNKKYNTYNLTGEYGIGYTSKGEEFYFDLEDYDKIKDYCWHINNKGYLACAIGNKKYILMHKLILNLINDNTFDIDHIKHKNNDNRKSEIRIVNRTQNQMNLSIKSNNTSGVTGVNYDIVHCKWVSRIQLNHKRIVLGYFNNFNEAIEVRKKAEEKYFGKYSYDNSIKTEEIYDTRNKTINNPT